MSMRYKGGVLSATPPTVTTTSAPGLWTMQDQMRYQAAGTWPPSLLPDPYFENVIGLFHFDGTNGAQNNTFLDSSANAFSITRNGNPTQGSFSPFSRADGYWSNYFDGSGDYFGNTTTALIGQSVTTFTVEGWIYMTANPSSDGNNISGLVTLDGQSGPSNYLSFGPLSSRVLYLRWYDGAVKAAYGSTTLELNQWHHIACVVNSNAIQLYVNGVAETMNGTTTLTNRSGSTGQFYVGQNGYGAFTGYLSNLRVTTTAVYTSGFTPSTIPLTAVTNTVFLTCQSNRFIDNSTNAYALTVTGNTSVQAFGPFNPTTAYSTTTTGGSGYFDGSGDYLTLGGQTELAFGTGDFTVEVWVYRTGDNGFMYDNRPSGVNGAYLTFAAVTYVSVYYNTTEVIAAGSIPLNAWTHVALSRSGTSLRAFVNGTQVGSTITTSVDFLSGGAGRPIINVNGFNPAFTNVTGYNSGLRVLKGTALYTANFTPPTSPPTNITNTSLLCNFTNAGAFDSAAIEDYETVGSSQLSTAQFKFGTSSLVLNGTTTSFQNTLRGATTSDNFKLGTGPFTVEGFLRLNSSTTSYPYVWNLYNPATSTSVLTMFFGDAGFGYYTLFYHNNNLINTSAGAQSTYLNTWKHFAVVRQANGTFTYYIDGVSVYSTTLSTDLGTSKLHFGNYGDGSTYGYLDEFRITKGVARYTANFTPPTAAFPNL